MLGDKQGDCDTWAKNFISLVSNHPKNVCHTIRHLRQDILTIEVTGDKGYLEGQEDGYGEKEG